MKNKIIYMLIGLVLISGLFLTRTTTIDIETLEAIDEARALDGPRIYQGFDPSLYRVDVNYGRVEYSYYKGQIHKQKPQYPLGFFSMEEEGGPVIKVLPINDLRKVLGMDIKSKESLKNSYVAMVAHEAFHCYQMDHGLSGDPDEEGPEDGEFLQVLERLDDDKTYQDLYIGYLEGLKSFRDLGDREAFDQGKSKLEAFLKTKLGPEKYTLYKENSAIMELVEGSARYVENKVLALKNEPKNGDFDGTFPENSSKFYLAGSLKVEILENQGKLGNLVFDLTKTLDDFME